MLDDPDDRYLAVLSDLKGCANSGLLVQQVLAFLERRYPDRFRFHDRTHVERIVVGAGAGPRVRLHAGERVVEAGSVVLCTNGYVDHRVEDVHGAPIEPAPEQRMASVVGFMAGFVEPAPRTPAAMSYIRNLRIGGATPYVYVTRRTYDRPDGAVTLTCMGGPERPLEAPAYDRETPFPGEMLDHMDEAIRPFAQPDRAPGQPYDFQWHGLMGYSAGKVRLVGEAPAGTRAALQPGLQRRGVPALDRGRGPGGAAARRGAAGAEHLRPALSGLRRTARRRAAISPRS